MCPYRSPIIGVTNTRCIIARRISDPGIVHWLDTALIEAKYGRVVFTVTPAEFRCNFFGYVDGGMMTTLIDAAMGCAIQSTLPAGV